MCRHLLKIAAFVPLFIAGLNANAIEEMDGVYQIGTAQDLTEFAEIVNSGNSNINAILTDDIDLSSVENFTPIAHHTNPYTGTFDGQGHVISNLNIDLNVLAETGLFYRVSGTVKNVGIINASVKNPGGWRAGVLAGCCLGAYIENCFTAGDIIVENPSQIGGLAGLIQDVTIINCYTTFNILGDISNSIIKNSYCGEDVAKMAPNGELCFKLNGDQSNILWLQTIGEDAYPTFDKTHKQVYPIGNISCDGTLLSEEVSYTNDKDAASQIPAHNFEDGFCTNCGKNDPNFLHIVDGWHEVGTPSELQYIANLVNSGKNNINVRLVADIDFGENAIKIGSASSPYSGTFDGQGHNITLAANYSGDYPAMFEGLSGTVENLSLTGSISSNGRLGGSVAGATYDGSHIKNVASYLSISTTEDYDGSTGGFIGIANGNTVLENCLFAGSISGTENTGYCGGMAGWTNNLVSFNNCLQIATITTDPVGSCTFGRPGVNTSNCYYLTAYGAEQGSPISQEQLESGEVCYMLNSGDPAGAWRQTLGQDAFPVPDSFGNHGKVYAQGDFRCDGQPINPTFTNTEYEIHLPDHHFVDCFCTECGMKDPDFSLIEVDGWYEVSTPGQLKYISGFVNSGNYNINIRLTSDIDLSGISYFPPIGMLYLQGARLHYGGTFDGQGHIIYNLSIDKDDPGAETGLFGRLDGATVKNLGIVNAIIKSSSALRAGVLAGCSVGSSNVINCFTSGDIMMDECQVSYNVKGGLIGLVSGASIYNCYTTYDAIGSYESSNIVNTYYGEDVSNMALSGELCYKLNGSTISNPSWYQTIGEDDYPVLDSTHGIVYPVDAETYASFQDEASFNQFRDLIIGTERDALEDLVATQSILDDCTAALDELSAISDKDEFLAAYDAYTYLKDDLKASSAAYQAYQQKAEETIAYFEENESFQGELRDQLYSYLQDEVEPNEDFEFGSFIYIMDNHILTTAEIQAETAKIQNMLDTAIAADFGPGTDITNLLTNGDFKDGWNGWYNGIGNGSYYYESVDIVGCEGWNVDGKIEQTVEGLKDGLYLVSMAAAYRPSNDPMSYAYNAYVYLNDNCVFVPACYETYMPVEEAQDGVNCNLSISAADVDQLVYDEEDNVIGYAIHGPASIAIAAAAGRSMCYMVAQVTDGKLTVGVNNPGSKYGSDWTGWANIHLTYLGSMSEADEQLNTVLAGQMDRANTLLNKYVFSSDNYYSKSPNFSQALRDQLTAEITEANAATTPEAKYALVEKFSQTFKDIYTCKRQYTDMISQVESLVSVATELYTALLISDEENGAVSSLADEVWTGYENGILDYDATIAQLQAFEFNPKYVDGWYELSTPKQLLCFGKLVNSGQAYINARLTSDIDLSGISYFPPIGTLHHPDGIKLQYSGVFDGQGHIIYNLSIDKDDPGAETGLFGRLDGATIKNLGIVNAVIKNSAALRAGVLAGCALNSSIINCFIAGDIMMEECICQYNHLNGDGLAGLIQSATVSNCYTTHDSLGDIYYTDNNNTYYGEDARNMAPTGELCYKLNGDQSTIVWFQTLGEDAYPVLDPTHGVVVLKNDKYVNEGADVKTPLITSVDQLSSNASDTVEGQNIGALIDGDVNTFWHTDWHNWCTDQYHYLQVELNEPVSGEITAEMTRRNSAANDHPTKMIVWGSTDGENFTEITTIDFAYDGQGTVATADFTVEAPVKYLRFGAADCVGEAYGYRTFWHAAEFQLYGVAGTGIEGISSDKFANGIFNLQGQKVEKATKGIYIIDGKKTLVK